MPNIIKIFQAVSLTDHRRTSTQGDHREFLESLVGIFPAGRAMYEKVIGSYPEFPAQFLKASDNFCNMHV